MATNHGASTEIVELQRQLAEEPFKFDFFQLLRLFEIMSPALPPIGTSKRADQEAIRLGQAPSLHFATSMLAGFTPSKNNSKPRLDVNFFGMFGPNGPLPLHLTEFAQERELHEKDATFKEFANIFHHRMLSLFYRAWSQGQPVVGVSDANMGSFFEFLTSFVGIGLEGTRQADALSDLARVNYAGIISMRQGPAGGLRQVTADYLQLPVQVEEFVGEWLHLRPRDRLVLQDQKAGYPAKGLKLGIDTTLGEAVWSCQTKFVLVCGPMNFVSFASLLPGQSALERLEALVRQCVGDEFSWDLQLVLQEDEVPEVCLGKMGQLGWSSWLGTSEAQGDRNDVVFDPMKL